MMDGILLILRCLLIGASIDPDFFSPILSSFLLNCPVHIPTAQSNFVFDSYPVAAIMNNPSRSNERNGCDRVDATCAEHVVQFVVSVPV